MEAGEHLQSVVNRIIPIVFGQGIAALTPANRNVFLVWSYPAAVNDGGHASFFYNSYGEHAHETLQALYDIGAPDYAQVLNRAIDLFPDRCIPRDLHARNQALSRLSGAADEVLEKLDSEFYALGDHALLSGLLRYWNGLAPTMGSAE